MFKLRNSMQMAGRERGYVQHLLFVLEVRIEQNFKIEISM